MIHINKLADCLDAFLIRLQRGRWRFFLIFAALLAAPRPTAGALSLNVTANVNVSRLLANQTEASIGIDPTNPNRLFIASNMESTGLFTAYSTNAGVSWNYTDPLDGTIADGNDSLPAACCDLTINWDSFGNLYLGYINDNLKEIDVIVSTNGGASFTKIITIASGHDIDQPTITSGTGSATGGVWITYKDFTLTGAPVVAQGAQVTGLGAIGAFSAAQSVPGSVDGSFGDISIGPAGQIMVTYESPSGGETLSSIYVNIDPDGFGPLGFGPAIKATTTFVGGFDYITPQPNRSVDAEPGLAYDNNPTSAHYGRAYLVYTEETPDESNNTDILVRFSDNNGQTWSSSVRVNDDSTTRAQFLPRIALDPTTGNIAVSWHDCRNDSGSGPGDRDHLPNTDAQFYASVSVDGGVTFLPNAKVSAGTSAQAAANSGIDYGDYTGLAFYGNNFYPVWADNSNSTGNNPDGTNLFDIYTARISLIDLSSSDLSLALTAAPNPVLIGSNLTYTLSITNKGPATATNVIVTNILPAGVSFISAVPSQGSAVTNSGKVICTFGNLASNAFATVVIKVIPSASGFITNTANVHANNTDSNPANNTASVVTAVGPADLQLTMSDSPDPVYVGYYLTYTMTVTNAGPVTATGVTITNTLPANVTIVSVFVSQGTYSNNNNLVVFNLGPLANTGTATITLTVAAASAGTITNSAMVSAHEVDTTLSNNTASATTTVAPLPPMISNVMATARPTSAFITWRTFSNATTQVEYGVTPSLGTFTSLNSTLTTNHIVWITGLQLDITYYFRVISRVGAAEFTSSNSFFTVSSLIVDNPDAAFTGVWTIGTAAIDKYGDYYQYASTSPDFITAEADYTPNLPTAGKYDVAIWYPQGTNRTVNAQIYISGSGDPLQVGIDQTTNGGKWNMVASAVDFAQGNSGFVGIMNNTGESNRVVMADAMRWSPSLAAENPTDGSVPNWWANFYFGTNFVNGAIDSDGDGYSNYQEFILGTAPNDAASSFKFRIERNAPSGVRAVFSPYQGARLYQLQSAASIGAAWTTLTNTPTINASGEGVFTVTNSSAALKFYRMSVQLAP